jgi:hypothetical protein
MSLNSALNACDWSASCSSCSVSRKRALVAVGGRLDGLQCCSGHSDHALAWNQTGLSRLWVVTLLTDLSWFSRKCTVDGHYKQNS